MVNRICRAACGLARGRGGRPEYRHAWVVRAACRQMKANGAVCKEMEAAAVGWACNLHSVPFFCIKSVTDIVDGSRCRVPYIPADLLPL